MSLSLEEMWVKAAVEHRLVYVSYKNPETRLVYNKREIRPDLITADEKGNPTLWGLLNHNIGVGLKGFNPDFFTEARLTDTRFTPVAGANWEKLVPIYEEHDLSNKEADAVITDNYVEV